MLPKPPRDLFHKLPFDPDASPRAKEKFDQEEMRGPWRSRIGECRVILERILVQFNESQEPVVLADADGDKRVVDGSKCRLWGALRGWAS